MTPGRLRKGVRLTALILFGIYLAGLVYFLFFAESYGRNAGEYAYNFCPFREIIRFLRYRRLLGARAVFWNLAGNILGFVPFGALLPLLSCSAKKPWRIVFLSAEISAMVEISQWLFQVGCFDVDDVILNTAGGLLGYLLYAALRSCYRRLAHGNPERRVKDGKATGLLVHRE